MSRLALAALVALSTFTLAAEPTVTVSKELLPALPTLCADLRTSAKAPAQAKLSKEDLLTGVLGDLGAKSAPFAAFVKDLGKLPVAQRRDAFKRAVSKATGAEWKCADFDALWDHGTLAP